MPKRLWHTLLLVLLTVPMLAAGDNTFDKLGHQLVCQCGCGQILLECNHVGCPVSGPMVDELHAQVAAQQTSGMPVASVLNFFITKYGPVVLAAPIRGGFDRVAWIVPFAVLILATGGVISLIRLWHRRRGRLAPVLASASPVPLADALRDRIRRETDDL